MDDAMLVRRFERCKNLPRHRQRLVERNRALRDAIGKRRPFDELQHERLHGAGLLEAVDGTDIRMIERRENLGLALEPCETVSVESHGIRKDLNRHSAIERPVVRAIDLTHPARSDLAGNFIWAEVSADR
jgi:hypothetical protein